MNNTSASESIWFLIKFTSASPVVSSDKGSLFLRPVIMISRPGKRSAVYSVFLTISSTIVLMLNLS